LVKKLEYWIQGPQESSFYNRSLKILNIHKDKNTVFVGIWTLKFDKIRQNQENIQSILLFYKIKYFIIIKTEI